MPKNEYTDQRPKVNPPQLGIAALRKSHRMTQAEVAKQVASIIDKPFLAGSLSTIEGGHRGASDEILRALEQVFGLATGDLAVNYETSHTRRKQPIGEAA